MEGRRWQKSLNETRDFWPRQHAPFVRVNAAFFLRVSFVRVDTHILVVLRRQLLSRYFITCKHAQFYHVKTTNLNVFLNAQIMAMF